MTGIFGKTGEVDEVSIYKSSFGETPNGVIYSAPMSPTTSGIVDVKKNVKDWYQKAANVSTDSETPGYTPMPLAYDRDVVDITRRFTPIKALLPKVTNMGLTANYFRVTSRGDASWQSEDPALEASDDTREIKTESIRYARVAGRVTGVAEIGGSHFESTLRREVLTKTQELNETVENALLNGDNSDNQYQPNGILKTIEDDGTNIIDKDGDVPTVEDVDELVNECFNNRGAPNLIITDAATASNLKNQIMNTVRYTNPYQSVAWGLQTLAINTVVGTLPVVVSQFAPTSSGSRKIAVVNSNYLEQRVLQDITFQRLAKTSDSEKFFVKTYMTLVNKFPSGMGVIKNCG